MNALFAYPEHPSIRRHGPSGCAAHSSYRPWLRDEFTFRCVYCLRRERMGQEFGEFAIDHFLPIKHRPESETEYENLLYVCVRCNQQKGDEFVADPQKHLVFGEVSVHADGTLLAQSRKSRQIIRVLRLNSPSIVAFRRLWIEVIELSRVQDISLFKRILGFPDELPDLSVLRPPDGNSRPEGVEASCFSRRQRGELPDTY